MSEISSSLPQRGHNLYSNAEPTIQSSQSRNKWVPRTERLAKLTRKSRHAAQLEHDRLEQQKRAKPSRKPTRAITSRQKSSKRSAEICRAKMGFYITLLEVEVQLEIRQCDILQKAVFQQARKGANLRARIANIEARRRKMQNNSTFEDFPFYPTLLPEPMPSPLDCASSGALHFNQCLAQVAEAKLDTEAVPPMDEVFQVEDVMDIDSFNACFDNLFSGASISSLEQSDLLLDKELSSTK